MEQPLVSIVIPFFSGVSWLRMALASVENQTYKNMEILVINDGSKENLSGIEKEYELDIRIINKVNGGPASARNVGIEYSAGKYVAFLDSDDLWLPEKLSEQINFMETYKYVWSQHSYEMFGEGSHRTKIIDTKIYSGKVYRDCFISFKVQTSCVVVLKSILIENNIRFPLEKRYGQDGDFYRQIAKKYELGYVNGIYSKFRIRGNNAGFRAKVQLDDKALTWTEIKDNNEILKQLPVMIISAYQSINVLSKIINLINKKYIHNQDIVEIFSKILYALPYIIFKIYSKKG